MSAGMAGVIAAHSSHAFGCEEEGGAGWFDKCECGHLLFGSGYSPEHMMYPGKSYADSAHATHVAEELAKAGYGDVRKAFGAAADELARLPYVKPDDDGRDEYERMLAIRRGDTDKWLREKAESHGVD